MIVVWSYLYVMNYDGRPVLDHVLRHIQPQSDVPPVGTPVIARPEQKPSTFG